MGASGGGYSGASYTGSGIGSQGADDGFGNQQKYGMKTVGQGVGFAGLVIE
jgi:hypothetical protein